MLHTVNQSAFTSSLLRRCLNVVRPGDGIVLLNEGIYGGMEASPCARQIETLAANGCSFYGLEPDAEKRQLADRLSPRIELIDFPEFVQLTARHRHTQSWF